MSLFEPQEPDLVVIHPTQNALAKLGLQRDRWQPTDLAGWFYRLDSPGEHFFENLHIHLLRGKYLPPEPHEQFADSLKAAPLPQDVVAAGRQTAGRYVAEHALQLSADLVLEEDRFGGKHQFGMELNWDLDQKLPDQYAYLYLHTAEEE